MERCSSLVNADRPATIASGEMYPEWGISQRRSSTRSLAHESSFRIAGNGMAVIQSDCRRSADPPKNESGRTSALLSPATSLRYVSAGNGSFIAAANRFKKELGIL